MNYKRKDDGVTDVLAERVEGLCADMSEMKHGIAKMADALPMSIPIEVEIGVGHNWLEAH